MSISKFRKKSALTLSKQIEFLAMLEGAEDGKMEPGTMDCDKQLREWLSKAMRGSKSRYQIAGELSEALGWDVSKSMLDSWTAESKEQHRIPAVIIPPLCLILGNFGGLQILAQYAHGQFLESSEAIYVEIARLEKLKNETDTIIDNLKRRAQALNG